MDIFAGAERLMAMDDSTWRRHANSWSVWTRILTPLPLLALAIWSRVWLGWGALVPVALTLLWIWINPRLFSEPRNFDSWSAHAVLGERVWLTHRARIARHHILPAQTLTALSALGLLPFVWGLWTLDPWATVAGAILITGAKTWFIDRMAWVWADFLRQGGTIAELERPDPLAARSPAD